MLLRTEILHDFDTFSPSPHLSLKKKKTLRLPAISNFSFHGSTAASAGLSLCPGPFRSLRAAPRGCVRREPVSDSRSAAGCAFARPGAPSLACARSFYPPPGGAAARLCAQGCAGLGSGGIRSYRRWRSSAAAWGLGAKRANGAVRKHF